MKKIERSAEKGPSLYKYCLLPQVGTLSDQKLPIIFAYRELIIFNVP